MKLWRIAAETRTYQADDLTGAGAALAPGRWNDAGIPMVYTATTLALAALETCAYVAGAGFPLNKFVVRIEVPADVWKKRKSVAAATLPGGWDAIPAGRASVDFGVEWLASAGSALLMVPSVIIPEEANVLINPAHADTRRIGAVTLRRFEYDRIFRG